MNITAIVCPHCNVTYDKDKSVSEGLNMNSTKCLRCNMPYVPSECVVKMDEIAFSAIGFKGER